jgi:hypothetical protein
MLSTSEAPTVRTTSDKFQEPIMSPEASPLAMVELNSIVGILIAKFPGYTRAYARRVVSETHRPLAAAARIQTDLIS